MFSPLSPLRHFFPRSSPFPPWDLSPPFAVEILSPFPPFISFTSMGNIPGVAGDVPLELLRMRKRTRGESNTPMFLTNWVAQARAMNRLVKRLRITAWYVDPPLWKGRPCIMWRARVAHMTRTPLVVFIIRITPYTFTGAGDCWGMPNPIPLSV